MPAPATLKDTKTATAFYWLALILTGLFTLLPGRIMYDVLLADG